jgi:hypothetical protein
MAREQRPGQPERELRAECMRPMGGCLRALRVHQGDRLQLFLLSVFLRFGFLRVNSIINFSDSVWNAITGCYHCGHG